MNNKVIGLIIKSTPANKVILLILDATVLEIVMPRVHAENNEIKHQI